MAIAASRYAYTEEDIEWARLTFETPHIEIDPWGNFIVSPPSDPHMFAVSVFVGFLYRQLAEPAGNVHCNGLAWKPDRGSGYLMYPDIMVVPTGWRHERLQLQPPPSLVVEVASPSTRHADRTRKLADYRIGGAGAYVLVDLPKLAPVDQPTADVHDFERPERSAMRVMGVVTVAVGDENVEIDLAALCRADLS